MKLPSFLSKLLVKFLAPSFLRKQATSIIGMLAGSLGTIAVFEPGLLAEFISVNSQVLAAVALQLITVYIDVKPETPEIIKE